MCFLRCSGSRTGHTSWCDQDKTTGNQMLYLMNLIPLTDVKILKELIHSFRTWRKIWLWSKRAGVWYDLWPPKLLGSFRGTAKKWRTAASHTREDALKILLTEEYMPGALGSLGVAVSRKPTEFHLLNMDLSPRSIDNFKKVRHLHELYTWARDTVIWYWSLDAPFWEPSIYHNMDVLYKVKDR